MFSGCNPREFLPVLISMARILQKDRSAFLFQLLPAMGLLICFFLPWVAWTNSLVSGYDFPSGRFFHISETKFHLGNPFPQLNISFYLFWLIPAVSLVLIGLTLFKKPAFWPALITGVTTLSLVTIYFLFSKTLIDLGVGKNPWSMMKIPAFLSALFSVILILGAAPAGKRLIRVPALLAGPVFAWIGFMIINNKVWNETFADTDTVKADYSLSADELIRAYTVNDTAANNRFREKILAVDGRVAQIELQNDSTANIKITGNSKVFLNFSLEKKDYEQTRILKPGDPISFKGSCSGSSYSMILDSTSVDFKRSTLNNK